MPTHVCLQRLTSQLLYCGGSNPQTSLPSWLRYGWASTTTVQCSLSGLLTGPEPLFYDLYVRDLAADQVQWRQTVGLGVVVVDDL